MNKEEWVREAEKRISELESECEEFWDGEEEFWILPDSKTIDLLQEGIRIMRESD